MADIYDLRAQRDRAYNERNRCIAAMARLAIDIGYDAWIGTHAPAADEKAWGDEWKTVIYIDLPTGQCSWHIHDNDRSLFSFLERGDTEWDGHDKKAKYERLDCFARRARR